MPPRRRPRAGSRRPAPRGAVRAMWRSTRGSWARRLAVREAVGAERRVREVVGADAEEVALGRDLGGGQRGLGQSRSSRRAAARAPTVREERARDAHVVGPSHHRQQHRARPRSPAALRDRARAGRGTRSGAPSSSSIPRRGSPRRKGGSLVAAEVEHAHGGRAAGERRRAAARASRTCCSRRRPAAARRGTPARCGSARALRPRGQPGADLGRRRGVHEHPDAASVGRHCGQGALGALARARARAIARRPRRRARRARRDGSRITRALAAVDDDRRAVARPEAARPRPATVIGMPERARHDRGVRGDAAAGERDPRELVAVLRHVGRARGPRPRG